MDTNMGATADTKVDAKMDETKVDVIGDAKTYTISDAILNTKADANVDANVEANVVAMVGARYGVTKLDVTIDKKNAK